MKITTDMLAPSYKDYKIVSEPYYKGTKTYVNIEHPRTHNVRRAVVHTPKLSEDNWDMKKARGFSEGPIRIVANDIPKQDEEYFRKSCARYAMGIHWHFVSTDEIPEDLPKHIKLIEMTFDEFKKTDTKPKSPEELAKIVKEKVEKGEFINE